MPTKQGTGGRLPRGTSGVSRPNARGAARGPRQLRRRTLRPPDDRGRAGGLGFIAAEIPTRSGARLRSRSCSSPSRGTTPRCGRSSQHRVAEDHNLQLEYWPLAASQASVRSIAGGCFSGTVCRRMAMAPASTRPASSSAATKFWSFSRKAQSFAGDALDQVRKTSGLLVGVGDGKDVDLDGHRRFVRQVLLPIGAQDGLGADDDHGRVLIWHAVLIACSSWSRRISPAPVPWTAPLAAAVHPWARPHASAPSRCLARS